MRPLLERLVSFRLSDAAYSRYEREAADAGMSLSRYLRGRLETDDALADHVSQLRLALMDDGTDDNATNSATPILVELLLLARQAHPPGHVRAVHAELQRQGMTPWHPV